MSREPRYDVLFEPVPIGPVTARNRFYQVPHCNGMGTHYPSAMAAMRAVKAEGGWAVVCTEECDFHHTGDVTPAIEARLWSVRGLVVMTASTGLPGDEVVTQVPDDHYRPHPGNLGSRWWLPVWPTIARWNRCISPCGP